MLGPLTSRAARELLQWSQHDLADKAGIGISTVISFENGQRQPRAENYAAMERAFKAAGIDFQNGDSPGVRLRRRNRRER